MVNLVARNNPKLQKFSKRIITSQLCLWQASTLILLAVISGYIDLRGQSRRSFLFDEDFWINSLDNPEIRVWSGYAFEQVCLYHLRQIKNHLGSARAQTQSSAWLIGDGVKKVQIDLIIDRRDHIINLCEMKFSIIYHRKILRGNPAPENIGIFQEITKTTKALWLTFITTFGLTSDTYAQSLVQNALTMAALFQEDWIGSIWECANAGGALPGAAQGESGSNGVRKYVRVGSM